MTRHPLRAIIEVILPTRSVLMVALKGGCEGPRAKGLECTRFEPLTSDAMNGGFGA
jgi:hypothetical protein